MRNVIMRNLWTGDCRENIIAGLPQTTAAFATGVRRVACRQTPLRRLGSVRLGLRSREVHGRARKRSG